MELISKKDIIRFNSRWKKSGDCHIWQGYLDKDGYGSFYLYKKLRRAHRVAYYIQNGSIEKGMVIDHTCRNPSCVNPQHLRKVSAKENTLNNSKSVGAINARKTHCKKGHKFDRKYGNQRYCSICQAEKTRRLRKKWKEEANKLSC